MIVNVSIAKRGIAWNVKKRGLGRLPPLIAISTLHRQMADASTESLRLDARYVGSGKEIKMSAEKSLRKVANECVPRITAQDLRYKYELAFTVPATERDGYIQSVIGDIIIWIEQHSSTVVGLKELSDDELREYNKLKQRESRLRRKQMNRVIRAKIKIDRITEHHNTAKISDNVGEKTGEQINAMAVYSEDKTTENYSYSVATPSLSLQMYISNPNAFGILEEGKEYYLDFAPVLETDKEKEARGHVAYPAENLDTPERRER